MTQDYVYVMRANDHIKIGIAKDVRKRYNSLRTGNHLIEFVGAAPAGNAATIEAAILDMFKQDSAGGEWLTITPTIEEWLEWFQSSPNVALSLDSLANAWADNVCWPWNVGQHPEGMLPLRGIALQAPSPPTRAMTGSGAEISSSESQDWYTPADIIALAREVMGGIDLDPMSCAEANKTVLADQIYTEETNGLLWPWSGRVWLNPPYGGAQIAPVKKVLAHYKAGEVGEAILCLNSNATTSKWFAPLFDYPICFPPYRVDFRPPRGVRPDADSMPSPSKGAVFVYLGPNPDRFDEVFGRIGSVVVRNRR